jgi:hypothetical protein
MSLGVDGYICVFNWWDWHVGKGVVVIEHVGFLSLKNYSLVISSHETCHYSTT